MRIVDQLRDQGIYIETYLPAPDISMSFKPAPLTPDTIQVKMYKSNGGVKLTAEFEVKYTDDLLTTGKQLLSIAEKHFNFIKENIQ